MQKWAVVTLVLINTCSHVFCSWDLKGTFSFIYKFVEVFVQFSVQMPQKLFKML